jgi:hypothetical protein
MKDRIEQHEIGWILSRFFFYRGQLDGNIPGKGAGKKEGS